MKVTLDLKTCETRGELHRRLEETLALPEWYGNNLDALHDCLSTRTDDLELTVLGFEELEQELGRYAKAFRRVLLDVGQENEHFSVSWM